MGQVYYHKGQYKKADELLSKTLLFFEEIKDERTVAEISNYLGLVQLEYGNLEKAESHFQNSLFFQSKNEYNLEAAQSALQLGKLNIQRGKAGAAIEFLEKAIAYNREIKNGTINQNAHSLLAEAYALQGNYKAAYGNSQIAKKINDSIQKVQSAEKIKELEGIYQTESRDREIALLTTQNELAEQQKTNQRNIFFGHSLFSNHWRDLFIFPTSKPKKNSQKVTGIGYCKKYILCKYFTRIPHPANIN